MTAQRPLVIDKLHILAMVGDQDPEFAITAFYDFDVFSRLLEAHIPESHMGDTLLLTQSAGDFTEDNFAEAVDALNVGPNDGLVCLFVGRTQYVRDEPNLVLGDQEKMHAAELASALKKHNAKLTVFVVDGIGGNVPIGGEVVLVDHESIEEENSIVSLLLRQTGFVTVASCSPGEVGYCRQEVADDGTIETNGSLFMGQLANQCVHSHLVEADSLDWDACTSRLQRSVQQALDRTAVASAGARQTPAILDLERRETQQAKDGVGEPRQGAWSHWQLVDANVDHRPLADCRIEGLSITRGKIEVQGTNGERAIHAYRLGASKETITLASSKNSKFKLFDAKYSIEGDTLVLEYDRRYRGKDTEITAASHSYRLVFKQRIEPLRTAQSDSIR